MNIDNIHIDDVVALRRRRDNGAVVYGKVVAVDGGLARVVHGCMTEYDEWVDLATLTAVPRNYWKPALRLSPEAGNRTWAGRLPDGQVIAADPCRDKALNAVIARFCNDYSVPRDVSWGCTPVDVYVANWLGYRVWPATLTPTHEPAIGDYPYVFELSLYEHAKQKETV